MLLFDGTGAQLRALQCGLAVRYALAKEAEDAARKQMACVGEVSVFYEVTAPELLTAAWKLRAECLVREYVLLTHVYKGMSSRVAH